MRKPIFESEEEFERFMLDMFCLCLVKDKEKARENGYIRRNPVEEYKYMIEEYKNSAWEEHYFHLHGQVIKSFDEKLKLANNAIQYLQNQIIELNKKVGGI